MKSLPDVLNLLKSQQRFHERQASKLRSKTGSKNLTHQRLGEDFSQAVNILDAAISQGDIVQAKTSDPTKSGSDVLEQIALFNIDPFSLDDLPEEISDQLNISKSDTKDARIIELLRIAERPLRINELLVGLYRKFQQKEKRNALGARLYRMTQRGAIVNTGKGIYSLPEFEGNAPEDESPGADLV